jgi:hypothetical protein
MKKIIFLALLFIFRMSYSQESKVELYKNFIYQTNYVTSIINKNISIDLQNRFFDELKNCKTYEERNEILAKYLNEDKDEFKAQYVKLCEEAVTLRNNIESKEELESIVKSNIEIINPPMAPCKNKGCYDECMTMVNAEYAVDLSDAVEIVGSYTMAGAGFGAIFDGIGAVPGGILGFTLGMLKGTIKANIATNNWALKQADCWAHCCGRSTGSNAGPGMPGGGPKWYPPVNY